MISSEDYKIDELYDRLFRSIDETFTKKCVIPKEHRVIFIINENLEAVQKIFEEHKAWCREKYGTDEGVSCFSANFLGEEKAKQLKLDAEVKKNNENEF